MTQVIGVSLDHPDTAAAEHWLASLDPAPVQARTHLIREPRPHVAWSLIFDGTPPAALGAPCSAAVALHPAGRAVLYPGVEALVGDLTVAEILESSAITEVEILGGGEPTPQTIVRTGGYVRPQWRNDRLVLTTMPAAGGVLVPFETRHPTPCCADHA